MASSEPYVVRQGDYLIRIAYRLGFDADAVWRDDNNASLKELRKDPNILCPTDVLYVPAPKDAQPRALTTGSTNTFVSTTPTVTLTVKFLDDDLASQPCTIDELDDLTDLATEADGSLTFDAPVTLDEATIRFTQREVTCVCRIGCLDPINTASGIFQRLQNLGYIDPDAECDGDLELLRDALAVLREDQSSDDDADDGSADCPDEGLHDDLTLASETDKRLRDTHGC